MSYCRWCKSTSLLDLWTLNEAPFGDLFGETAEIAKSKEKHSLVVTNCENCGLLQLRDETNIHEQYDNYLYHTGITVGLKYFYESAAIHIIKYLPLKKPQIVVDIGSNDGSFLVNFLARGFQVLGVEPSNLPSAEARSRGVETINEYFGLELSKKLRKRFENGIDLVSANFVLANVPDVNDFLSGMSLLLSDDGIFSIITGYHPDQFSVNMFDYINHDHLSYFSLGTLEKMLNEVGLFVYEVTKSDHKGGSIHIVGGKNARADRNFSLNYALQREEWKWISNLEGISRLAERVSDAKAKALRLLEGPDKSWLGIGASISTTYLINHWEIANKISFLIDDDSLKRKRFSPYFAIEVLPFDHENLRKYDNAIILAWQHTNVLLRRLKQCGYKGKVLIPLPDPRVIYV